VTALAALAFALFGIHVGPARVLDVGYAPAWSPDGARIAYVTRGDLWVADADGTHRALFLHSSDQPAWSPDGRRIAFTRAGDVLTIRVDGTDERRLGVGAHPAWSPDGQRLAFDRDGEVFSARWYGGDARDLVTGSDPAYAPDGRLAVVQNGEIVVRQQLVAEGTSPGVVAGRASRVRPRQHDLCRHARGAPRPAARLAAAATGTRAAPGLRASARPRGS